MQIEAGKYYKTRDGRKVGPMAWYDERRDAFKSADLGRGGLWLPDGKPFWKDATMSPDLIAQSPTIALALADALEREARLREQNNRLWQANLRLIKERDDAHSALTRKGDAQ